MCFQRENVLKGWTMWFVSVISNSDKKGFGDKFSQWLKEKNHTPNGTNKVQGNSELVIRHFNYLNRWWWNPLKNTGECMVEIVIVEYSLSEGPRRQHLLSQVPLQSHKSHPLIKLKFWPLGYLFVDDEQGFINFQQSRDDTYLEKIVWFHKIIDLHLSIDTQNREHPLWWKTLLLERILK